MSPRTRFELTALPQICRFLLRPWRRRDAGCSHSGHTHVLNLRLAATRRGCVDSDWSGPIPKLRVSPTSPTRDPLRTSSSPAHRRLRVITVSYMTSTDGFYIRSTATDRPRLLLIRNTGGHARLAVADPWAWPHPQHSRPRPSPQGLIRPILGRGARSRASGAGCVSRQVIPGCGPFARVGH